MTVSSSTRRDPRSPLDMTPKNVTVAETCSFYGIKNSITQCRDYPRSCIDCLAMEGCAINGDGRCVDESELWGGDNYRSAIKNEYYNQSYPYITSSYNTFLARTTTYCSATDPVCSSCKANFTQLAQQEYSLGTQFCVGENGCVCIALCEEPARRAQYAYDFYCDIDPPREITIKPVAPKSFSSKRRDPRATLSNLFNQEKGETCAHTRQVDVQGNGVPRTCQDCLLQKDCVINRYKCESMENYNYMSDFRTIDIQNNVTSTGFAHFPSVNTTYCPSTDQVCSNCREKFQQIDQQSYYSWENMVYDSMLCLGENGCVCIEACESTLWAANVPREYDYYGEGYHSVSGEKIGILIGVFVLLLSLARCFLRENYSDEGAPRRRVRAPVVFRHTVDQAPSLPHQLSLSGWRGFRENLVSKEHRGFLQGGDPGGDPVAESPTGSSADYMNAATTPVDRTTSSVGR